MQHIDVLSIFCTSDQLIQSVEEFNSACDHIVALLEEANAIFHLNGYSTSTFIAIAAIEETAKAHLGIFSSGGPDPERRKDNIFYNHSKKHQIAASPTVSMGSRLKYAIGEEALTDLLRMSHTKELLKIRESSLYFERQNGSLKSPRSIIGRDFSRSILLYAVEVFDDALVGYTDYSMKLSSRTNHIFKLLAKP